MTASKQEHCGHECKCFVYLGMMESTEKEPCVCNICEDNTRPHSSQPVPELPENYWHCPFRKGCEVGESYCDWPCDKWATWHDDNIRKAERERVLDTLLSHLAITLGTGYAEDEKLWYEIEHMAESLRDGEQR